jgi:hypothetical protein
VVVLRAMQFPVLAMLWVLVLTIQRMVVFGLLRPGKSFLVISRNSPVKYHSMGDENKKQLA